MSNEEIKLLAFCICLLIAIYQLFSIVKKSILGDFDWRTASLLFFYMIAATLIFIQALKIIIKNYVV